MTFLYLDKAEHLHATTNSKTAAEFAKNGKFLPLEGYECKNGYPLVNGKVVTEKEVEAEIRKGFSGIIEVYKKLK